MTTKTQIHVWYENMKYTHWGVQNTFFDIKISIFYKFMKKHEKTMKRQYQLNFRFFLREIREFNTLQLYILECGGCSKYIMAPPSVAPPPL